jgi:hypothetical protein
MVRFRRRVARIGPGRYAVRLPEVERELVRSLAGQLTTLLHETTDDPSVRRLFPTAYHDDAERDREYQQLVRDELLERRLAALDAVQQSADAEELDHAGATALLTALNDLRLVIGTQLDVSEDDDDVDPDDPDAPARGVYGYLTMLLGEVVDALEDGLADGV